MTQNTFIQLFILTLFLFISSCENQKTLIKESISVQRLSNWRTLDKGKITINKDELIIEEIEGSDGFFLISPQSYHGDIILNYQVQALSEASVLIALFAASDMGPSEELTLPPEETSGQGFWTWRTGLEHYNLSFNNRSHGTKPFFFKNLTPNARGFYQNSPENIMDTNQWHDVEIGKTGHRLWFKLNNEIIFEQHDCQPLKGGHLMLRISGVNGKEVIFAKAAIKNLTISHE